ncbi:MAG: tRNA pseudouridine(13) synthase TruD [Pseudomonadota bacterium]
MSATVSAARVTIKAQPGDWQVHEQGGMAFTGAGEHAYFYVEKTTLNSMDVARLLGDAYGCETSAVGLAGLKDKHAITRQWFSVPTPDNCWRLEHPQVRCLESARHLKKLRRGELVANRFVITLRDVVQLPSEDITALNTLGFANFFGPQRVSADNVAQATQWLLNRRRRKVSATRRGWYLSVMRSHLFNTVLQHRLDRNIAAHMQIAGDALLDARPAGPLWGRGRSVASEDAQALETTALEPHAQVCEALEYAGVSQGLRAYHVIPENLAVTPLAGGCMQFSFSLPPGAYATVMLASLAEVVDASAPR